MYGISEFIVIIKFSLCQVNKINKITIITILPNKNTANPIQDRVPETGGFKKITEKNDFMIQGNLYPNQHR